MGAKKGARASPLRSSKLLDLLRTNPSVDEPRPANGEGVARFLTTTGTFPRNISPCHPATGSSPFPNFPWVQQLPSDLPAAAAAATTTGLVGSLVCQEGYVYSLAAAGDLLYAGSDSRNIRVWKGWQELSSFRSSSGLVKAIVIARNRVFTGHQDGKIRVWRTSSKDSSVNKRVGTLPTLADFLMSSIKPSNYVEARRHRTAVWLRHFDAVSCLSLEEDAGILYSGSWDKTVKVWRLSDSKCLESFNAHDDAVNAVAAGFDGLVFTGSADGTVKAWRREVAAGGKVGGVFATRHVAVQTLLRQDSAVTAVATAAGFVYCGSSDGVVNHWQREGRGGPLASGGALRGHRMAVLCLAAAGSIVASGSADKTVRVWRRDERSGAHGAVAVLSGHAGPIKCLAVEAEAEEQGREDRAGGRRYMVHSGSLDKSIKIWRVAERRWSPEAARGAPRDVRASAGYPSRRSPLHACAGGCGTTP
ncbi:unnamed protein product [Musa textilis]